MGGKQMFGKTFVVTDRMYVDIYNAGHINYEQTF